MRWAGLIMLSLAVMPTYSYFRSFYHENNEGWRKFIPASETELIGF